MLVLKTLFEKSFPQVIKFSSHFDVKPTAAAVTAAAAPQGQISRLATPGQPDRFGCPGPTVQDAVPYAPVRLPTLKIVKYKTFHGAHKIGPMSRENRGKEPPVKTTESSGDGLLGSEPTPAAYKNVVPPSTQYPILVQGSVQTNQGSPARAYTVVFNPVIATAWSTLWTCIVLSQLVVAVAFYNDCPAEPSIPLYCLWLGVFCLCEVGWTWYNGRHTIWYNRNPKTVCVVDFTIATCQLCSFTIGGIATYRLVNVSDDAHDPNFCHPILYWVSFATVTSVVLMFLVSTFFLCWAYTVVYLVLCREMSQTDSGQQPVALVDGRRGRMVVGWPLHIFAVHV